MRRCKSEKVGDFKMGVMDVIKYNGRPDVFVWKYPGEELGTWSQLVVNQSQEAVLVKGGSVADVFGPGTHTLDTKNRFLLYFLTYNASGITMYLTIRLNVK